jgi:hypothetical protein
MFKNPVRHFALGFCFACCCTSVNAAPIGYAFSGTLDQPYNGATQFSGNFTYDTDLPLTNSGNTSQFSVYSGVPTNPTEPPVSVNISIGSTSWSFAGGIDIMYSQVEDAFTVYGLPISVGGQQVYGQITLPYYHPGGPGIFSSGVIPTSLNLAEFNFSPGINFFGTNASGQVTDLAWGTINSLTPLAGGGGESPVPEPSSIFVFLIISAGLAGRLRTSSNRKKP